MIAKLMDREIISHMTDVEGNWDYFNRWMQRSQYLALNEQGLSFRQLQTRQTFVYGGDFCDKGAGDLRIGRALVDFKRRYPHNVYLIAGNREIKFHRLSYELSSDIRQQLLHGKAAYWNPHHPPRQFVIAHLQKKTSNTPSSIELERFIQSQDNETCKTLYLQWMLEQTMGCASVHDKPSTFEYRRQELAALAQPSKEAISDNDVMRSFLASIEPGGVIRDYLKEAMLGVILGETLFIHGAVTPMSMGYLPGMAANSLRLSDAREWVSSLNEWYATQIKEWLSQGRDESLHEPGTKALDRYVICNPRSVVTSNWYSEGKLAPIHPDVIKFLNKAGVYRVISGHQPFSDFPLLIRHPDLEVIVGDTSYSDRHAKATNRGIAIHNLSLVHLDKTTYVLIDALRKNGNQQSVFLPSKLQVQSGMDSPLGHFTEDGSLIRLDSDGELISSQLDGFRILDKPYNAGSSPFFKKKDA